MNEFCLGFHWIMFLRFELTIFQHWFRQWLGADQATSHYLNQGWLVYLRRYASLGLNGLITHLVLRLDYSGENTGSSPWVLMPWLLASTGYQQPYYWSCKIKGTLSSKMENLNNPHHCCWINHAGWLNDIAIVSATWWPVKNCVYRSVGLWLNLAVHYSVSKFGCWWTVISNMGPDRLCSWPTRRYVSKSLSTNMIF